MKQKVIYCWECAEDTIHNHINTEKDMEGLALFRPLYAICTLGLSETWGTEYWQCTKCGKVNKKDK